ncbi:SDR family oxidoreductase [Leptospira limi]|uniref:SDR family oxidoreductase n=1 Tax=Leptospira limi TaxID=2950023 RepID=A0ABT3LZ00_9LEPT|nr:SDR family oxidoreductase [Leptospira limi]MCW7462954.1 SDR family oxidoreductase [Leptospira limi]
MSTYRILITGGSGLLGGRLVQYFSAIDNIEIYLGTSKPLELPSYVKSGKVRFLDWDSESSLKSACLDTNVIIHCAGMNAQDCQKNPERALEFNGFTTGKLLDAAIKMNVSRFIYISTAHVYDSPLKGLVTENSPLLNSHPYATSNVSGEQQVNQRYDRITGINVRLSNAYGAPVSPLVNCWMLLVNDLCKQAVTTNQMVLKTSGIQIRDFIPISEVCRAIHHLLNLPLNMDEHTFNLGGNMSMSVWDMALLIQKRCKEVLGFSPNLQRVSPSTNEVSENFEYDTTKLLSTGYKYLNYYQSEIDQLLYFCNLNFKNVN